MKRGSPGRGALVLALCLRMLAVYVELTTCHCQQCRGDYKPTILKQTERGRTASRAVVRVVVRVKSFFTANLSTGHHPPFFGGGGFAEPAPSSQVSSSLVPTRVCIGPFFICSFVALRAWQSLSPVVTQTHAVNNRCTFNGTAVVVPVVEVGTVYIAHTCLCLWPPPGGAGVMLSPPKQRSCYHTLLMACSSFGHP